MRQAEHFAQRLLKEIHRPSNSLSISAFRLYLEETNKLSTKGSACHDVSGELTLIWQDGAVSVHPLSSAVTSMQRLPLDSWKNSRFLDRHRRYFASGKQISGPFIPVCEQELKDSLQDHRFPARLEKLARQYHVEISWQQRFFFHSQGTQKQEQLTSCLLLPISPVYPFSYASRKMPTIQQVAYLQLEYDWFHSFDLTAIHFGALQGKTTKTFVLFSPDAFRTLLHYGIGAHLTCADDVLMIQEFLHRCSAKTTLSLSHDPYVPWSPGSFHFTMEGTHAPFALLVPAHPSQISPFLSSAEASRRQLPARPGYQQASLHWNSSKVSPFRGWLTSQEEVFVISGLEIAEPYAPAEKHSCLATGVVRFSKGRPQAVGSLLLLFSLHSILCSSEIELVSRTGWDGCGVALPVSALDWSS